MLKKIICFVFLLFMGFEAVRAEDVKVKLNSADGATSFQVRNLADVVVSSITSLGDAVFATVTTTHTITAGSDIRVKGNDIFFGGSQTDRKIYDDSANYSTRFSSNVYIEQGALRDRTVESADLSIISSATFISAYQTTASNAYADIPSVQVTVAVDAQPSTIFAYFTCTNENKGAADDGSEYQLLIDGTAVANVFVENGNSLAGSVALIGTYKVTSTGDKIVKVQHRSEWDTTTTGSWNCSLFAYVMGSP